MFRQRIEAGDRVALAPHTDEWMRGRRYGTVRQVVVTPDEPRKYLVALSWSGHPTVSIWYTDGDLLGAVRT